MRAGNLRFSESRRGDFIARSARAGPLPTPGSLRRLLAAIVAYECDRQTDAQFGLLLETGELLGGSRPKVTLRSRDGRLLVAKFPSREDGRDMQAWECLTLGLASDCGIAVPPRRLLEVAGKHVLLLERFDRDGAGRRTAFVTAMGLLQTSDNESLNVVRFAERVAKMSAAPREDLLQLWMRTLFDVLVSNKDNHLRNHGMRLAPEGWRLAPAYDINPEPQKLAPRQLILSIDGVDDRASLEVAMACAVTFGIDPQSARSVAAAMAARIQRWKSYARACGIPRGEIARMQPAFEHADLERALRG
jgi:serine/threonine-protein kinase HipA